MSRGGFDAVVIGAGVVGASAALGLAQDGRRVALVEAREPPAWSPQSADLRVYALANDSIAQLRGLEVWPAVAGARAQPYRRMQVWDAAGGAPLVFDTDRLGRTALGAIVENDLLVDRLWHALQRRSDVALHCPDRVASIEQGDDGVTLRLDGGQRLRARIAIVADGGQSAVRAELGIDVDAHDYGQSGLVAYVRSERPHAETCWQRFMPTGPLALLPCADGRSSIVWTLPDADAQRLAALPDDAFDRELTRASDGVLGALQVASKRVLFPLRRQLAQRYAAGRCVLAGDAAHVVHPLAGQGVNLGLRDIAALRRLIAAAGTRDIGAAHRLDRYARERRSENAIAAWTFDGLNRLFSNAQPLATLLRGPLLGAVGRVPGLAELFARNAGA